MLVRINGCINDIKIFKFCETFPGVIFKMMIFLNDKFYNSYPSNNLAKGVLSLCLSACRYDLFLRLILSTGKFVAYLLEIIADARISLAMLIAGC